MIVESGADSGESAMERMDTSAPLASPLHYLGHRLRILRQANGLSRRELAGLTQVDPDRIGRIEQADPTVGSAAVIEVCDRALHAGGELIDLHRMITEAHVATTPSPTESPCPNKDRPAADDHGAVSVPRQLPAAIRDFTGRAADLMALDALLPTDTSDIAISGSGTVVISAIDGAAGIGKTTLAVHWGHRMRHRFPDGTLYANLRGYGPGLPATADEVLDAFLRALGTAPGRMPSELEERSALYRSLLDGKRVLVVLDNAGTPEQVRPLLPGGPGCLALVTSRSSMTGLVVGQGAARISLDLLSFDEAVMFLRGIVGDARADAEPQALVEIVHACARLPLALRIAGARAAARPLLRLSDLQAELLDQHTRLDTLSATGDETTAVRTIFAWSYQALPAGQALVFRRLGLHPGVQIDIYAAAALADTSPHEARSHLEALSDMHLVEPATSDHYLTHDLLRAYAAEQSEHDDTAAERHEATMRLLGYYLHTADTADRMTMKRWRIVPDAAPHPRHSPPIANGVQGATWFDAERDNLVAAARHAADTGLHAAAWQLAAVLYGLFDIRGHRDDRHTLLETGSASAQILGDQCAEHYLLTLSSDLLGELGRLQDAEHRARRALRIAHDLDDPAREATALNYLGRVYIRRRDFQQAADYVRKASEGWSDLGDAWSAAIATSNLGQAYEGLERLDDALTCYRQAFDAFRASGDRGRESWVLRPLGDVLRRLGQLDQAAEHHRLGLQIARETQRRFNEAEALHSLGDDLHLLGDSNAAREHWTEALAIYEQLGDPRADDMRAQLRT